MRGDEIWEEENRDDGEEGEDGTLAGVKADRRATKFANFDSVEH